MSKILKVKKIGILKILLILSLTIFLIFSTVLGQESKVHVSKKAQDLISHKWDSTSFNKAISIMNDKSETLDSRRIAMEILHTERLKLENNELRKLLNDVTIIMKDPSLDTDFTAQAIYTMGNLTLTLEELGVLSRKESIKEGDFLLSLSSDTKVNYSIRTQAIKVLGILNIPGTPKVLEPLLTQENELNIPEIARPACLTLVRVDKVSALPILKKVIELTTNSDIFGTAAFSLGQIKNVESMNTLVENAERFRDVSSCSNALTNMESVIIDILKDYENKYLSSAIKATLYLWKKEQREAYKPLLLNLIRTADIENKKLALDRLIEDASHKEFNLEMKDISEIYEIIKDNPNLVTKSEEIKNRMTATLLIPTDNTVPVPAQPVGGVK